MALDRTHLTWRLVLPRKIKFLPAVSDLGFNHLVNFVKMTTVKDWGNSCSSPQVGAALSAL